VPDLAPIAWALVAGAAPLDWWAVGRGARRREWLLKPLVLAALLLAAALMGATDSASGWWLLAALTLSLAGDVALLSDSEPRFVLGLASFLLAHVAYVLCFALVGLDRPALGLFGVALVAGLATTVGRRVVPAAAREGGAALGGACATYMLVIGAMVVAAWATGRPLVALGATVFMVSDAILAWDRFVRPVRHGQVAVMVTYHVGQVLIVLGLLR
jgi:uncharacterized membrane protein YhhN